MPPHRTCMKRRTAPLTSRPKLTRLLGRRSTKTGALSPSASLPPHVGAAAAADVTARAPPKDGSAACRSPAASGEVTLTPKTRPRLLGSAAPRRRRPRARRRRRRFRLPSSARRQPAEERASCALLIPPARSTPRVGERLLGRHRSLERVRPAPGIARPVDLFAAVDGRALARLPWRSHSAPSEASGGIRWVCTCAGSDRSYSAARSGGSGRRRRRRPDAT